MVEYNSKGISPTDDDVARKQGTRQPETPCDLRRNPNLNLCNFFAILHSKFFKRSAVLQDNNTNRRHRSLRARHPNNAVTDRDMENMPAYEDRELGEELLPSLVSVYQLLR